MKFSYNWICELVEGVNVSPKELGELITMKTAECEGVEEHGAHLAQVCAARVAAVEAIPGSRNKKVVVETGRYGRKTVVCGAPNCREGLISAYVPPGVRLRGREIREIEVSGVISEGMLASGAELGINRDGEGILEVTAEPGAAIPGCAPDFIIEIDNKSITHRPDLWGHHGLAREVAAILRRPLKDPVDMGRLPEGPPEIEVRIEDFELCPRYSALTFDNVRVGPAPLWMQYRLESIGLNTINNIVDVTNYIMSEIAEPMHAFDRDALRGNVIIVRRAAEGEYLAALNNEIYRLDASNLVIADARGPVAIAGVIGGLDTGVVEGTRRLVLESANFRAASIRKTSAKLKLRTDASMRFEKGQDPANTVRGLARAVELFEQVSPGIRVSGGPADAKKEMGAAPRIVVAMDWLERKLGRRVEAGEVCEILGWLQFGVEKVSEKTIAVTAPSWRATRDISIKDEIVEEVGRMLGYDSIVPQAPHIPSSPPPVNEEREFHHEVRAIVAAQGFHEVYNYSFVSEEAVREFGMDPAAHVAVTNPIASGQSLLRMSLLPGIVKNIRDNSRHFDKFRIFEIGYEIHRRAGSLPEEIDHMVAAVFSREEDDAAGLFELKRLAECLMPGAEVQPGRGRPYEHPARAGDVMWRGKTVGRLFELFPGRVEGRAALMDLNLQAVRSLGPVAKKYRPLRRFPASAFDLSVVVGQRELCGEVQRRLAWHAGASLESVEFLRQYSGPPLEEGKKSLSYRLTVYAPDHTLTAEEVSALRQRIIDGMRAEGYEFRL